MSANVSSVLQKNISPEIARMAATTTEIVTEIESRLGDPNRLARKPSTTVTIGLIAYKRRNDGGTIEDEYATGVQNIQI